MCDLRIARLSAGLLIAVAFEATALAGTPETEGFRRLSGAQIRHALIGKHFSDNTHFSFRYRRDGQVTGKSMGREVSNTWKIVQDELCVTQQRFGETCYRVWKRGTAVRLVFGSDANIDGEIR